MTAYTHLNYGGAYNRTAYATGNNTATAAGAGDNVLVNTAWVDRELVSGTTQYGMARSCKIVVAWTTTLTAAQTLSFAGSLETATTIGGAGAEVHGAAAPLTVVATGAGTVTGTTEFDYELNGAERFIRAKITPDLSAGATDTVAWSATIVFYGHDGNPVSRSLV